MSCIGIVIIGRNEGERLIRCLDSILKQDLENVSIVYVDSGSTDGSCEVCRERGIEVVELDLSLPFTAARARNAGFERLYKMSPTVEYVQFIDGDCELVEGWLEVALEAFKDNPDAVAVCGLGKEQYSEKTIYNRICSVEWQSCLTGETQQFGGIVMIRADTFLAVGGFNPTVIAAEDDELSVRLRQAGGKILRLGCFSYLHDANIHSFWQWWRRAVRTGFAYAQVSYLHGAPPERKFVREIQRIWLWGLFVPFLAIGLAPFTHGLSLLALLRYPLTALRVTYKTRQQGFSWVDSIAWGLSCTLTAFPGLIGVGRFYLDHLRHRQSSIIEYKSPKVFTNDAVETVVK